MVCIFRHRRDLVQQTPAQAGATPGRIVRTRLDMSAQTGTLSTHAVGKRFVPSLTGQRPSIGVCVSASSASHNLAMAKSLTSPTGANQTSCPEPVAEPPAVQYGAGPLAMRLRPPLRVRT